MSKNVQKQKQKKQFNELSFNYTFWVQQLQRFKGQAYGSALKQLATVSSIKQFWQIFQYFKKTSDLPVNCDIYMFKEGIKPEWQDKENVGGGCFKVKIQKGKSNKLWENAVFALVSPSNKLVNSINGIRIKIKEKFDEVQIWLHSSASQKQRLDQIKAYFRQNLQVTQQKIFHFYPFTTK